MPPSVFWLLSHSSNDIRLVRKLSALVSEPSRIRRALISCSDKLGLVDFAAGLTAAGIQILSTGGTRRHLESHGIDAIEVAQMTNFPEMMDGRVKTLHPKIFGGILGRRDNVGDLRSMQDEGIPSIDLVVVNLYPFEATINRSGVSRDEAIEQIDIGGPSLIRAAAKNHQWVTVATRPEQYSSILRDIEELGTTSVSLRRRLAGEAFAMTAAYDQVIADYFRSESAASEFPPHMTLRLERKAHLRYGENPHQKAAVYRNPRDRSASVLNARHIHGRELSYNNLLDLDSALSIARAFGQPAAAVVKHNNPCGAATCAKLSLAIRKALDGDPVSAFGSVLGFNRTVDLETAEILVEPNRFIEAIVAPDFEAGAVGVLTTRPKWRDNVRLMQVGRLPTIEPELSVRFLTGGALVQEADTLPAIHTQWRTVTDVPVADALWDDIHFAWEMVRHVKSNAIVLARDTSLVGVGAGQMSRVDSVEISIRKAGDRSAGCVMASDAFFPFPDSIEAAARAGVVAIVQPGGSRRDDEVIAACNLHRIPMVFTGARHFKH
ncbi:MAG: bifunctional phosphoribosylaminoimidazolecarboxamide formyltransferase/IMP cyclohydrolase [Pirellulaceae bacterium]|nr:bifunctional phosphoribosylaminoimidazolecarboxamide formyltransferase/IMP cyclohydrolase [Pirellulaceae bacterium]